jgi:hypothetical protein
MVPSVRALAQDHPRILPQPLVKLADTAVEGVDAAGTASEQDFGEAAR